MKSSGIDVRLPRIGILFVVVALLTTSLAAMASAQPSDISSVPDECLFSTADARAKLDRDDPSLYGLSVESIALNVEYQLFLEEQAIEDAPIGGVQEDPVPDDLGPPIPEGAVIWSSMALTPEDAERLQAISTIRRIYGQELYEEAMRIAGDQFVGVTWSYVDGFVVSDADGSDIAAELKLAFPGIPMRSHEGLVPEGTTAANLEVLAELGHEGFIASSDKSCGITFVAFSLEPLSQGQLDELLVPGTYRVVDIDYFGGAMPQAAAGKSERKGILTGGLKIWTATAPNGWCTSNVVGRKNNPTQQWLITAGHCVLGQTLSGTGAGVHTLTGSHWYQGAGQTLNNRISKYTTQYMALGGNHDIQVIQLRENRTPSHQTHELTYYPYPGAPLYDAYIDPTWWYYNLGFETSADLGQEGSRVCQSGYTINGPSCGVLNSTTATYTVGTGQGFPYTTTMTNVRYSSGMDVCAGDSGGTVWVENNDDNIAGIVHANGPTEFTRIRESNPYSCGNSYYTGISSLLTIGLANPWGMP